MVGGYNGRTSVRLDAGAIAPRLLFQIRGNTVQLQIARYQAEAMVMFIHSREVNGHPYI